MGEFCLIQSCMLNDLVDCAKSDVKTIWWAFGLDSTSAIIHGSGCRAGLQFIFENLQILQPVLRVTFFQYTKVYVGDDKKWILVLLCKLWTMLSHKTAIRSVTAVLPKVEGLPCFSILFAFKKSHCLDQTCSHSSSHYCKCLHAGDNVSPAILGLLQVSAVEVL